MADKTAKTKDASNNGELIKASDINLQLDNVVNVPIAIMKRVNSLKNLQVKLLDIESKFFEELHLLECKYSALYEPLYEKRKLIVIGEYEPTEEESKWTLDDDLDLTTESEDKNKATAAAGDAKSPSTKAEGGDSANLAKELKDKANLSEIGSGAIDVKGVPDFWLQTFKSVELIADMVQEYDEPVLKHLYDVKVKLHDQKPYGYTLEFYFNENEFFTNSVLTKSYELRTEIDQKDPFSYEGPDLYKCKGCTIDWKKGKNVTVRLIKKKQKHKGHGTIRVITKEIKQDSFFNYFDTPEGGAHDESAKTPVSSSTEDGKAKAKADKDTSKSEHDEDDEELKDDSLLAADFEIGHFFKERIIPKAVLYFTGEIADDDYDDYDEDEEDDDLDDDGNSDQDDDDDDDDDDGGHNRRPHRRHDDSKSNDDEGKKPHGGKGKNKGGSKHSDPNNKNNPPECKQN